MSECRSIQKSRRFFTGCKCHWKSYLHQKCLDIQIHNRPWFNKKGLFSSYLLATIYYMYQNLNKQKWPRFCTPFLAFRVLNNCFRLWVALSMAKTRFQTCWFQCQIKSIFQTKSIFQIRLRIHFSSLFS